MGYSNNRSNQSGVNLEDIEDQESTPLFNGAKQEDLKTYYEVIFVVLPLFSGYACLFALQRKLKEKYGIGDNNSDISHLYGVAASLVYMGNLIFRLGHNVIFFYFSPRARVICSMGAMCLSMLIITLIFFVFEDPSLVWVFIAYGLGGVGIGTFESNLLSTIAPLGQKTKLWAIIGIPTGIILITVGGFMLMELGVNAGYIYLGVCVSILFGLVVFMIRIYWDAGTGNYVTLSEFLHELKEWRQWLPMIKWHSLALMVDMFFVSLFSPGMLLYVYDEKYTKLTFSDRAVATDWLFAVYNAFFFLGDTLSRKIFYPVKIIFPLFFWIFSIAGATIGLSHLSLFVPLCGLLVAFANGSIYAQANRKIDQSVNKKFSLIAFSFWLFIGDVGSVCGSNLISFLSVDVKNFYN